MARALRRTVITGGVTYPAGTPETAALAKKIPNPVAWEGEADIAEEPAAPKKTTSARKRTSSKASTQATASAESTESTEESTSDEPPRGGEGSTEEAWREYAAGLGIEVPEDAGRDDIVALVDARDAGDE